MDHVGQAPPAEFILFDLIFRSEFAVLSPDQQTICFEEDKKEKARKEDKDRSTGPTCYRGD